jgi:hypothetical protein
MKTQYIGDTCWIKSEQNDIEFSIRENADGTLTISLEGDFTMIRKWNADDADMIEITLKK